MQGTEAWQMPQGGIDENEDPREAALRELKEEIGTDRAQIIAESKTWLGCTTIYRPRYASGGANAIKGSGKSGL